MVNVLDKLVMAVSPQRGLERLRARSAAGALMNFDAANPARKTTAKARGGDADTAGAKRMRLAFLSRDMIRNNPWAANAQHVVTRNVVGDGILSKIVGGTDASRKDLLKRIERHLDTTKIDIRGRQNLYGIQALIVNTVVDSGEALVRRVRGGRDMALPFQLEVMEPDFLDTSRNGPIEGGMLEEGIEFDDSGRRVAYWLYEHHPGSSGFLRSRFRSVRVPASEILHIYRQDRPGQERGVSWLAPVALQLQDMHDFQDAQLMRQKISACFAAFRITPDTEPNAEDPGGLSTIVPGRIQRLAPGEDVRFADPPGVQNYDEFTRSVLSAVAAGMHISFDSLTGDLRQANFSSLRAGNLQMNLSISSWQWLMLIPQFLQPLAEWIKESWLMSVQVQGQDDTRIEWVPPRRPLVDPAREIPAMIKMVRAGFISRAEMIRQLGFDAERVTTEIKEDAKLVDELDLTFDTDPRKVTNSGQAQQPDLIEDGD